MTIAEVEGGDTFCIDGKKYRAMIKFRDAWGCRVWEGDDWSHEHYWFTFDIEIEDYEEYTLKSVASGGEDVDPMARR